MVRLTQVRPDSEVRTVRRAPSTPNLDAARGKQTNQRATSNPNVSPTRPGAASNLQTITETLSAFGIDPDSKPIIEITEPAFVTSIESNPLSNTDSLSFLWTLACLSKDQLANPSLYRTSFDSGQVVFSSAGRFDAERAEIFKSYKPEYFITDFKLRTVIANNERSGNTTTVAIDFTVFEPYSLGHLLESLNVAALGLGYKSYLNNTPFVLRLDIVGQNDNGTSVNIPPRFFPIRLASAKFSTNEAGSTYNIKAIPFNHIGFSDQLDQTHSDVLLSGKSSSSNENVSVYEILADTSNPNSLVNVLNRRQEDISWDSATNQAVRRSIIAGPEIIGSGSQSELMENVRASITRGKRKALDDLARQCIQSVPDRYEIYFAKTASDWNRATTSTGDSSANATQINSNSNSVYTESESYISKEPVFIFDDDSPRNVGIVSFLIDQEEERDYVFSGDGVTTDYISRSIQFSQGRSITDMITQVIIRSAFANNVITKGLRYGVPPEYIPWFKIDVQLEFLEFDELRQDFAKKITFRVTPYNVHQSFNSPDTTSSVTRALTQRIKRRYEYIYTGQNTEVLDFKIEVNNLFYTRTQTSGDRVDSLSDSKINELVERELAFRPPGSDPQSVIGQELNYSSPTTSQSHRASANFMQILNTGSSADLIVVDLEILGDPWFLSDSGLGNYIENASQYDQETELKKMNYEAGEVYIEITFRNPVDMNTASGVDVAEFDRDTKRFSGIFRVIQCENMFSDGVFKQRLRCVRIAGQTNASGNTNNITSIFEESK